MATSEVGIVLLDSTGRVLGMNEKARALLSKLHGFVSVGERWVGPKLADGESIEVPVRGKAPAVGVSCFRVFDHVNGPSYTVIILRAAPSPEWRRNHLTAAFGLTPAEARLAEEVLDGRRPAQAAQHAGVTIYTVRTYLKRLYAKTGTHTQASLLRVLLKAME